MPQCVQANFSLVSLLVFTPVNEWLVLLAVDNGQWGSLSWLSLFSLQNKTVHGGRKSNPLFTPLTLFLQSFILWCWVFMADRGPEAHSVGRAPMGATRNLLLVPTLTARNYSMPCWKVCGGLETGDMWSTLGEHTRASCGKYGAVLPCVRALVVGLWPELLCCIFEQIEHLFPLYFISNSCFSWPNTWKQAFWVCLCFAVAQKPALAKYSSLLLAVPCRYWDFPWYFTLVFPNSPVSLFNTFISPPAPCLWGSTASSIQPTIMSTLLFRPDLLSHNVLVFVWSIVFSSYQIGVIFGSISSWFLKEMSQRNPIWELPLKMNGSWVGILLCLRFFCALGCQTECTWIK